MASGLFIRQRGLGPKLSNDTMRFGPIKHNKLFKDVGKCMRKEKYVYKITTNSKIKVNK